MSNSFEQCTNNIQSNVQNQATQATAKPTTEAVQEQNALPEDWQIQLMDNYQRVAQMVHDANAKHHKQARLLCVSKTKPAQMIRALAEVGQQDFGENYLQEALVKIKALADLPIVWHYIGHIQRNKTRDIAQYFDWVQTVERDIIAKRLHEQRPAHLPPLNVLIEVNIDDEASKSGCLVDELDELIGKMMAYDRLALRGLMIIPSRDGTDAFARTKSLFDDLGERYKLPHWDTLSMGMSGDMLEAIEAGSTVVRVGTAIFGARE